MKEDAIEYFEFHRKIFCEDHLKICPKDSIAYQATLKEKEFYDLAIKALKQDSVLDKIKAEIKEWYWQADKQALAEDPCVVDAMIDLFIRTINKYKAGMESEE